MKLFYRTIGSGKPVIILHGFFGMSDFWLPFSKKLSKNYQFIIPDLRNHGRSFHHPEMNYDIMVDDIISLMDSLGIQSSSIIGHSMGGKLLMKMLDSHQNRVKRALILDIAPKSYFSNNLLAIVRVLNKNNSFLAASSFSEIKEHLLSIKGLPKSNISILLKNLHRSDSGGFCWRCNMPILSHSAKEIGSELLFSKLINNPVSLVRGRFSDFVLDSDLKNMEKIFSNFSHFTIDAGHWLHIDNEKKLLEIVKRELGA